jgi:hypothetical protein
MLRVFYLIEKAFQGYIQIKAQISPTRSSIYYLKDTFYVDFNEMRGFDSEKPSLTIKEID